MSASNNELLAALEAARADYAKTHCGGDTTTAYGKIAAIALGLDPGAFGGRAVLLPDLADKPELAALVLEGMQRAMKERRPAPQSVLNLRVMKKTGLVIPDEENVLRILTNDPNLQGVVRFDEFSGDMILARPITADCSIVAERGIPRPWADADTVVLQTYMQRHILPRVSRDKIEAVVAMYARHNCAFHPVRDYLQSISWDRVPRLDTWLRDYLGANNQPEKYLAGVGAAWLIAAVARIFEPGCQADNALVLEGAQGIFKSTALRVLAGDAYFSDSLSADLSHKDARDHLRGKWILELAELAQFKRAEIETVKQFISRRFEQYRPSYGHHEIKFPRQCVFAGSTNDKEYLSDPTGNRRFWVVACNRIELDALKRDRDQLWAEAVTRFRAGEQWHLTNELEALAAAEARLRVSHDPWTAKVAEIVAKQILTSDVTPGEVMALMDLQQGERHARNAGRVGNILKELGWREGRRDRTRGQIYMPPSSAAEALTTRLAEEARHQAELNATFASSPASTPAESPARKPGRPLDEPAPVTAAPVPLKWEEDESPAEKVNGATHEDPAVEFERRVRLFRGIKIDESNVGQVTAECFAAVFPSLEAFGSATIEAIVAAKSKGKPLAADKAALLQQCARAAITISTQEKSIAIENGGSPYVGTTQ
jgi:predicted P-loop ATPase